jgi:hypothetical protein
MRLTATLITAIMAIAGTNAAAAPPSRPVPAPPRPAPPAPVFNTQSITCGGAGAREFLSRCEKQYELCLY